MSGVTATDTAGAERIGAEVGAGIFDFLLAGTETGATTLVVVVVVVGVFFDVLTLPVGFTVTLFGITVCALTGIGIGVGIGAGMGVVR